MRGVLHGEISASVQGDVAFAVITQVDACLCPFVDMECHQHVDASGCIERGVDVFDGRCVVEIYKCDQVAQAVFHGQR